MRRSRLGAVIVPWVAMFALVVFLAPGGPARAQTVPDMALPGCVDRLSVEPGVLRVAIRPAPPFVQEHPIRQLEGISIDLWEAIARDLGVEFAYVCLSLDDTLFGLTNDWVDVAISPLTISAARERAFDFSHQYFNSSLVVAGPRDAVNFDFDRVISSIQGLIASPVVLGALIAFAVLVVTVTMAGFWQLARLQAQNRMLGEEKYKFPGKEFLVPRVGMITFANLSGLNKEFLKFETFGLQALYFFTVAAGALLSAAMGGLFTAILVNSVDQGRLPSPDSVPLERLSTLDGSTADRFITELAQLGVGERPIWRRRESWAAALDDLVTGEADLVVGDWVQLAFLANQPAYRDHVVVDGNALQFEPYGWGMAPRSPFRDLINQRMIAILRSEEWPSTVRGYVGTDLATN